MEVKMKVYKDFPKSQYMQDVFEKRQVYLHHTVSGPGVVGDIAWWEQTKARIATTIIIDRDGVVHCVFDSKYWAHHLGVKQVHLNKFGIPYYKDYANRVTWNEWLNMYSIGVELDSLGPLELRNGKFRSIDLNISHAVPNDMVYQYDKPHRGYYFYEKYTEAQISTLKFCLEHWSKEYGLCYDYEPEMWEFNEKTLKGERVLNSHTSARPDKSDVHPQESLVKMLKSL